MKGFKEGNMMDHSFRRPFNKKPTFITLSKRIVQ